MASITQQQIDDMKSKGLTDQEISTLAAQKGYQMPSEQSTTSKVVGALTKSERGFGQSIAGAIGGAVPALAGGNAVNQANDLHREVQSNVLKAIQEKRAKGEDTTRLMNALKTMDSEINFYDILNKSTGMSLDKSAKQVFGEGLGVATDIIGAGALPGGIGNVAKTAHAVDAGRLSAAYQGIKAGAKAGAVGGGIFGAAQGVAGAAQADKSAGQIVGAGIGGGVTGGIAGGVLGGALGGVSGSLTAKPYTKLQDQQSFTYDLISRTPTAKVGGETIAETAIRQGRATEPGIFTKAKIAPSAHDNRMIESVQDVVSSKKTIFQNVESISKKVSSINAYAKQYITDNKAPFNTKQLLKQMNTKKAESKLIFASDTTAENTYNAVVDEFMKHLKGKDTRGLFDARQFFDKIPAIKKLLNSEGLGENVKRQIVLDVRSAANDYIAALLPKDNPYRVLMQRESLMLEALGNIAEKNKGIIGMNNLQRLQKAFPALALIVGTAASTLLGAKALGVGSSIISSTD